MTDKKTYELLIAKQIKALQNHIETRIEKIEELHKLFLKDAENLSHLAYRLRWGDYQVMSVCDYKNKDYQELLEICENENLSNQEKIDKIKDFVKVLEARIISLASLLNDSFVEKTEANAKASIVRETKSFLEF